MVYKFFDKKTKGSGVRINLLLNLYLKMDNYLMNFINLLLENFKKGKYIQHSNTIFGLQI